MARAYGEAEVINTVGAPQRGVPVDLLDPTTGLRIADTVYADSTSATTLGLPLTTDNFGKAPFWLAAGKVVRASYTVGGVPYTDLIAVTDPTALAGGGGGASLGNGITTTSSYGQVSSPGSSVLASREDHYHGMMGFPSASQVGAVDAGFAGTSGTAPSITNKLVDSADTRMTNARTPSAHATTHQPGGTDAMAVDQVAATASLRSLGTTATQAAAGNHTHASSTRDWEYAVPFIAPVAGDDGGPYFPNVATSITGVRVIRTGGTSLTVDVKKNGTTILTGTISAGTTPTAGTLTTNPIALATTDILIVSIATSVGGVAEAMVKVEGTRP